LKPIYEELKRRHILIRYIHYEGYGERLAHHRRHRRRKSIASSRN